MKTNREQDLDELIALVAETKRKVTSAAKDLEQLTHELRRRLEAGEGLDDDDTPVG